MKTNLSSFSRSNFRFAGKKFPRPLLNDPLSNIFAEKALQWSVMVSGGYIVFLGFYIVKVHFYFKKTNFGHKNVYLPEYNQLM